MVDVADRHPLDPAIGDDYSKCSKNGCNLHSMPHCHCDYHDGSHGCAWGNSEFVRRLTEGWLENSKQLAARKVAHALGRNSVTQHISDMTVEDFLALPHRTSWNSDEGSFGSLVFLPMSGEEEKLHDSGWRCMDFVGCRGGEAIVRLAGGSDVLHIDGIGGAKFHNEFASSNPDAYRSFDAIENANWQIDCLRVSGLFNLIPNRGVILVDTALSSFEIYCVEKQE